MLKSVEALQNELDYLCKDFKLQKIEEIEWVKIRKLLRLHHHFFGAQKMLEGEQYLTASFVPQTQWKLSMNIFTAVMKTSQKLLP